MLPPILRNKSLSQLEQMADQLDGSVSRNIDYEDLEGDPYGSGAHGRSMMSNNGRNSALDVE